MRLLSSCCLKTEVEATYETLFFGNFQMVGKTQNRIVSHYRQKLSNFHTPRVEEMPLLE
jgi:hypothetical protein